MSKLPVESDLGCWRLLPGDHETRPLRDHETPVVSLPVVSLPAGSETLTLRANIAARTCVLSGDAAMISKQIDGFAAEIKHWDKVGYVRRSSPSGRLTATDISALLPIADLDRRGVAVLLDTTGDMSAWTQDMLRQIKEHPHMAACFFSPGELPQASHLLQIYLSYGKNDIPEVFPKRNQRWHTFSYQHRRDEGFYRLVLEDRPAVSPVGVAPVLMPGDIPELLFLIRLLNDHGESTTSETLANYTYSRDRRQKGAEKIENQLHTAQNNLGKTARGYPRLWKDPETGSWHHEIPIWLNKDKNIEGLAHCRWFPLLEQNLRQIPAEAEAA